jgi:hydrogenase small subunit
MKVTRRQFLTLLGASSAAMVVGAPLQALALPPGAKKVIWLQGSGCTGCSVSFLNRISAQAPQTADDVLLDIVELDFHTTLMAAAGDSAVSAAEAVYAAGGYLLVVEGGVPTAFGGAACWAWTRNGVDMTFLDVVKRYAGKAAGIICIGNCASWGGIASSYPNPTSVKGVSAATGKKTINVAGCPAHPDWFVWVVAQVLTGATIALDSYGRPKALFGRTVHEQCPRRERERDNLAFGVDSYCLEELGCRGPETKAPCPIGKWNGGVNWCVDANAPCIGCTEPNFPVRGLMGYGESED